MIINCLIKVLNELCHSSFAVFICIYNFVVSLNWISRKCQLERLIRVLWEGKENNQRLINKFQLIVSGVEKLARKEAVDTVCSIPAHDCDVLGEKFPAVDGRTKNLLLSLLEKKKKRHLKCELILLK
ncbi:hypothetical protein CFOL_v3_18215 [Cephalotus follicularis]|uniref:Uncharacterized protein n=1 Tax=Cephalotus follicularis TaxID=3775 RepID=A0A1Q3C3D0_CEPFO|nr:hypothetical protein CFOL_v3_18215 [Cephalotus follicularis]